MANEPKNAKEKLEQLAEHLRRGWKAQYPVTEEHLSKVREAMQEQWQEEQKEKQKPSQDRENEQDQDNDQEHER